MRWTASELADACGGELVHRGSRTVARAFIDSRRPVSDGLFVAIVATRDGHDFIPSALKGGAAAVLLADSAEFDSQWLALASEHDASLVRVKDTVAAFSLLAARTCAAVPGPRVVVSGSNGKTTTRSMIAELLAERYGTDKLITTRGNLNNHLGVPLCVVDEPHLAEAAVLELGMSAAGENAHLAAIVQPTLAVVTSIALEHLESMGSLSAIARAELEPAALLPRGGALVIPQGVPELEQALAELARPDLEVRRVGLEAEGGDVRVRRVELGPITRAEVQLASGEVLPIQVHGFGVHNARNAAMALAVAELLSIPISGLDERLAAWRPVGDRGRMLDLLVPGGGGSKLWVIADCYNANPGSMSAALSSLAEMRSQWPTAVEGQAPLCIALLGDMLELGEESSTLHAAVGHELRALQIDGVCAVGTEMAACFEVVRGSVPYGQYVPDFSEVEGILEAIHSWIEGAARAQRDCLILVKGSRGIRLERVVERLRTELGSTKK